MEIDRDSIRSTLLGIVQYIAGTGKNGEFEPKGGYLEQLSDLDELLCMWFDDSYYCPHGLVEDGVLTRNEEAVLSTFSKTLRTAYPRFEKREAVDIRILRDDPKWKTVMKAAEQALMEWNQMNESHTF